MKPAILSLLLLASTVTTAAFAQEGMGQGPPGSPIVVGPLGSLPTTTSPAAPAGTPKKLMAAPTK